MATRAEALSRAPAKRRFSARQWRRVQEIGLGYTFLAPVLILLLVCEFFPIFYGAYISLCDWRLSCVKFVALDNYVRAFNDPEMWHSLMTTTTYSSISVPLQLSLGLFIGCLLFQKIRGQAAFARDVLCRTSLRLLLRQRSGVIFTVPTKG